MLELYKPKYEDLWFRQLMLEDNDTMSYNHSWGGAIPFPKEDWHDWYDYWIINNENKRYYRYLKLDNTFIGEVSYHYDNEINNYVMGIIIYSKYRHYGYGKQGLELLCKIAKDNGIKYLYDDIAIDNSAIKLFLDNGFIEEYRTDELIYLKKTL